MAATRSTCATSSRPSRMASRQASFTTLPSSAPEKPGVPAATSPNETSGASGTCWRSRCTSRMARRPASSGSCTLTCRSKRPGRSSAESNTSGRLVAAMTTTGPPPPTLPRPAGELSVSHTPLLSKPSISVRSWFNVCSRSSLPKPPPVRDFARASSSSKKRMHGAQLSALLKRSRTRAAPRPTKTSTKSEAEQTMMLIPASCAAARASSVFPQPGGPERRTPRGQRAPILRKRSGDRTKSTTSCSSRRAESMPATCSQLMAVLLFRGFRRFFSFSERLLLDSSVSFFNIMYANQR
mmetsp:Transcript_52049/g.144193  ORF Transcript_52049/g.144193 Transcript_52049/m.144193 type:complete len:296 (-) Transcript_52049:301-1188(-)